MRPVRIAAITLFLSFPLMARAELVEAPPQPDAATCEAIAKNNGQYTNTLYQAHNDCLKVPGDGNGVECAKAHCLRLHRAMEQASTAMSQINSTCNDRLRRSQKILQDARAEQDRMRQNTDWLEKAGTIESNVNEYRTLSSTFERPLERLASLAGEGLGALTHKIGSAIRTQNGLYSDPNAALLDEIFSRAGQANRALSPSPFRAFVTEGALNSLYFGQAALEQKMNEIETLMNSGFATLPAPPPQKFVPTPVTEQPSNEILDCSLLADTEKSRRLSQTDQAAWLGLVTKCGL